MVKGGGDLVLRFLTASGETPWLTWSGWEARVFMLAPECWLSIALAYTLLQGGRRPRAGLSIALAQLQARVPHSPGCRLEYCTRLAPEHCAHPALGLSTALA